MMATFWLLGKFGNAERRRNLKTTFVDFNDALADVKDQD